MRLPNSLLVLVTTAAMLSASSGGCNTAGEKTGEPAAKPPEAQRPPPAPVKPGPIPPPAAPDTTHENFASFGPLSPFEVIDRRVPNQISQLDFLADLERLLSQGRALEEQGRHDAALLAYATASAKATVDGLPYVPISLALFRMYMLDRGHPDYPYTAFSAAGIYKHFGRQLLIETLENTAATLLADRDERAASVVRAHLSFVHAIDRQDVLLAWQRRGFVSLGDAHLRVLVRAMLGHGMVMSDGRWSVMTADEPPGRPESWQIEDRGVLKDRAFKLDQTRAFVPGIRALIPDREWKAAHLPDAAQLLTSSVWEFALAGSAFADIRDTAYTADLAGSLAEVAGKRTEAIRAYEQALAIGLAGGYLEPVLKIGRLGGASGSLDLALLASLRTSSQDIKSMHAELVLAHQISGPGLDATRLEELLASVRHSVYVRDLFLGRGIVAAEPRDPSTGVLDGGERIVVLGRSFINEWMKGMRDWGVRLMANQWRVEAIGPEEWRNAVMVTRGYWKGCSRGPDGSILVAGLRRIRGQ